MYIWVHSRFGVISVNVWRDRPAKLDLTVCVLAAVDSFSAIGNINHAKLATKLVCGHVLNDICEKTQSCTFRRT